MDKLPGAQEDLRFLLDRGYRKEYALKFVGDHHNLLLKERNLLFRQTYSQREIQVTLSKLKPTEFITGRHLVIDGFNVLITIEHAMANGEVFLCQDGLVRDNVAAFSNYKIKESTRKAADKVIEILVKCPPKDICWVFDSQISGSGTLSQYVMKRLSEEKLQGESITSPTADHQISKLNLLTATSDSALIDRLVRVVDLPAAVLEIEKE
ncbi:MAG: DUF434 domain-containing protein [Candidatus Altiarchaeota archaeon]|nr:DUF434 domain-containing protein [Candidatus Altiarchaeota archaeon]